MPPVGFEPTISAGDRPQTYALDRAATGNGLHDHWLIKKASKNTVSNLTRAILGLKPDLRGGKTSTNPLTYGTECLLCAKTVRNSRGRAGVSLLTAKCPSDRQRNSQNFWFKPPSGTGGTNVCTPVRNDSFS